MWGRIYPHAVFLIFGNIMLEASCKNGSLTFLIDDTSSMGDDIKNVRKSVYRIKDIVLNETSSLIDNMVLITLNDPGVHKKIATKDPNEFKKALDAVKEHNELKRPYLDCWEPAMKGLLLALDKSNNDSYIFVFTDAPAKDYIDSQSVIEMCQKKQTQIVFVLTGTLCKKFSYAPAAIDSYFDIAAACSGLAFFVQKNEVDKVFGPIEEIIKGNKNVITTATVPAGVSKNIPFTIDDYTDYVLVYASGKNVSLKIKERSLSSEPVMSTDNAKVIKLNNAKPGSYVATVKGATRTSVIIVGRTDFFFSHGFSESKPKSLNDTLPQPISDDANVYLSVSVRDDKHSVNIVSAQLLDMDGKPILTNLILSEISKDFYVTDPFVAPSQRFKVAVNGIVKGTRKPISRTAKIPVTPPPPKIAPKVQGVSVLKVKKGETALFECKVVRGFPAPKITWLFGDKSGSEFKPIDSESVLLLTNVKEKDDGKYKCVAENVKGKDEHVITLTILDQPKIVSSTSTVFKRSEGDALLRIPCSATGLPKPSITWKLNGRVIYPSAKYSTQDGTLIIRDLKRSDTNSYVCEAKNEVGVVSATFRIYIGHTPQVSGVAAKQATLGSSTSIECIINKGEPKPKLSWQFMNNSSSKFSPISGSDKVLHIPRVESKDAGRYKCVAQNSVGSDEHITTLEVQDPPKIVTSLSTTCQSTEGDSLLRIPCAATGLPKPKITWKLNGRVINSSMKYSIEDGSLIIKNPTVGDTNSYTCEAHNEVGTDSATFRAYIHQTPQVSGIAAKQARLGSSASIECTINKGEPKPKVTWQFMDNSSSKFSPIPGSDKVLHISRVESKDAGRYKCVAQNSVGSDEHITTLEVQDPPKIVTSLSTTCQSTEGDSLLRIPCAATGLPKPKITWKLNGRVINSSMKYSIEDGSLIIKNPTVSDTNSYTCEAHNEVGTDSATFRAYIHQTPQVSGIAAKQARLGSSASIECTINKGEPKPKVTWQFMDNSSSKFSPIPGSDKVLHISRVESKDAGRYKCVAQNSVGSDEHITTLEVQDPPKIVTSLSTTCQSTEGDSLLRIPCAATGLPKPKITWKLNGRVINSSMKYSIEDGSLIIKNPTVSDTNSYTCEAHNEVGTDSATFRAYIHQTPQVSGIAAKQARLGSSASIECTINKGAPKPKVTWQFMDNSSSKFSPISGSDKVLHISRVESKDAGRYKCVAQNSVGSDEHITTLEVQDPPKIVTSLSTTCQSTEGDSLLRIPCAATGLPKPKITWKLNGRVINSSMKYSIEDGSLIIKNPTVGDTNSYTCEAHNEVGTDSATFRAYIHQTPQVSGIAAKQARLGSSASIECTINKGEPKPKVTWQFMDNSSSKFSPIPGSDKVLHISRVESKDAGRYKCVAQNSVGSDEHITTLEVQDPPKIVTSLSTTCQSTEGDSLLRIPCAATGLPKPKITWKSNGRVINSSMKYSIEDGSLIIKNPTVGDTNSYTCEAHNEVGTDSATFRAYIHQTPEVSGIAAKQARLGSSASIECTINKGEPKPKVTWQFMDNSSSKFSPIPGSDKVLHISRVESKDAGRYKCVAQNSVGSDEHITTLEVQDPPKIVTSLSTTCQSTEGDSLLRIPCAATGLPKPKITWKLNGRVINSSMKYSIEDGSLIIKNPTVGDTNSYTCEAHNEVGTDSATFRAYIHQTPQVSGIAAKQARLGSSASIECTINKGAPKPKVTWQFMDNSSSKFSPISGSDKVLHISRVESKDAGRYKCVAQNSVGSDEHITTLEVQDPPKIVTSLSTTCQSTEGDSLLRIPCAATGLPKPKITWKLNGRVINSSMKYSIEDGSLIIKNPTVGDTNSYTCEAHNEVGTDSATFRAYIHQTPEVSGIAAKQARLGSSASIECTINKGEPKPKVTWQFMDNSSSKFSPIPGSDKVLHISRVESKDAGRYKCVAQNSVGSDEHITTLEVQDPPKIVTSLSTTCQSTEGDSLLRIPCAATGLPKPKITWKLNGRVINSSMKYSIEDGSLIIKNPTVGDTNSYTCEAHNEVGTDSATFRAYIHQTPQVSGIAAKQARLGSSASIECTINKGAPKPKVTWQFMDNSSSKFSPISGSDKVLHISRVESKDAGRYKCVAQNSVGSDEHITTLEVQDPPKIVTSLSTTCQSTEGDSLLRIPCAATGLPKPKITWKLNGRVINSSMKYSIEDGSLIIKNPTVGDTNSYTCEAHNEVGTDSATFRAYIHQTPQVSGIAAKQARLGSSASIECTINKGEPKPKVTWQFMDNSSSKFSPIPGSDKVLHISRVESKDAGRYKCVAQNSVGSDEHITTLEVQDPPKIVTSLSTTCQSTEGDSLLRIPCAATGLPKPKITWKSNGRVINSSMKYSIEDGSLIIKNPTVGDSNSYTCEAHNEVGTDSATFRAYIHQTPQVSGIAAKQARLGSSASIECTINKGEPKPKVTWQFMDNSSSKFSPISGSDKVLHVSRVESKDAGRYKCVAQNSVGSDEHITTLEVQDPPKIVTSLSTTCQSTEGDSLLRIPCAATGLPKPKITWKLNGRVINSSMKYSIEDGSLIIKNPTVGDTNSYTCEAHNEVGTDSATFRAYIRQTPQVSGIAAKQARLGSSASIECTINKGEPKPKVTWQFMDNSSSKFSPISGSDKVLHVSRVESKDAGRYKCVAQNSVGSDEHITTLEVQDPPKIVTSLSTTCQSTEGESLLRIPCAATGLPKPKITWKSNGRVINSSMKYSIEDGSLIIKNPTVGDTNSYTCEAHNEVGTDSATFRAYIHQTPQVSGIAAKQARLGSSASIECTINKGAPKPKVTWQFMDNSSSKFLPIPGSDKVLHISRVESKDAGRYKCVAQNSVGSDEHITTLEVQELPKIDSSVSTIYESTEGDALLRIPCIAAGLPKPTITWKLDGHVINPSAKYSMEDGTLIIRNPKHSDTNSYTCEAKNEVGTVRATFKTYIRQFPKLSGVAAKNVRMGSSVYIECKIDQGEPTPKISWQFMDKAGSKFVPIAGAETKLRITNAENKHAGRYKCVAQNNLGSDEHITALIVESLPGITINSTTIEGIQGDLALKIPCNVVGVPQPAITWKINDTKITPNEKYSIEDGALVIMKPAVNDSLKYTCEAKNYIGSIRATFQATVTNYPKSFGTEHYVYLRQGETRKLECEAYTSESQSIKWFETKLLDSSLSTTSSPPEIDSFETTNESTSNTDSSTTSPTIDTGNSEPYVQIVNASSSKHDGNYTCHVSDKHGNTQTHTYVVDVGIAPEFVSDDNSISDWRGDITDITQYCDIQPTAKPTPVIQWTFNDKVIIDLNSAGVGQYTCNVSNVHGFVLKRFDVKSSVCLITRNLKDAPYMPLVLNDKGSWHKLKTTKYYMIVEQGGKIILSCPSQKETSNTFENFQKKTTLKATCYKEDFFKVDGKAYKLSDLKCNNSIQPSVIRKKVKCSTDTSELMRVGYNVPGFLEAYEVCFDQKIKMPLYTRILMTETNDNGLSAGYNWYTYPGIGYEKTERGFTCKDASSSCCYSKSQLVNAIDFNDGPAKKSTFIDPLNAIPVWRPCNVDNYTSMYSWEDINDIVRSQLPIYSNIVVWTGTHTLQEINGATIPRYLWKVVRLDNEEVIAIVHINDPKPTEKDIKCKSPETCEQNQDWFVRDDSTYCCLLPDFLESFEFYDTDIGDSLDAALHKMKKIPDT